MDEDDHLSSATNTMTTNASLAPEEPSAATSAATDAVASTASILPADAHSNNPSSIPSQVGNTTTTVPAQQQPHPASVPVTNTCRLIGKDALAPELLGIIYGHVFNGVTVSPHPYDGNKNTVSQANAGLILTCRAMYIEHIKPYYQESIFVFEREVWARNWLRRIAVEAHRHRQMEEYARFSVKDDPQYGVFAMYWMSLEHVAEVPGPNPFKIFLIDEQNQPWTPEMTTNQDMSPMGPWRFW